MRPLHRNSRVFGAVAVSCGVYGATGFVHAQQIEVRPEPLRIEVTGSRIARIDGETALPVQLIRREEIQRGNWSTAAELMAHISANFNGTNNATNIGRLLTPGLSSANLRGLGDGNTLVLLNGRRMSNYAFAGATVDLSTIPLAAIERVEILKDGASSIYGSDAIAGVVNFITRNNFAGAEFTGDVGITEHGGGDHHQATVTVGWGDLTKDRFNAFVTLDWQKDTSLNASERPFASTGYRPDEGIVQLLRATFPANVRRPNGSFRNPSFASGCMPPLSIPLGQECRFDYANTVDLLPQQEQWNIIGRASWEWAVGHQVFAEFVYSRNELEVRNAPTAASRANTIAGSPILYPAGGPFYPTQFAAANGLAGPLEVYFRLVPLGHQIQAVTTDGQRVVVGAQGTVDAWSYNAGYTHSVNTADWGFASGYVATVPLQSAMASGLVNPFGASGPAGLALLQSAQVTGTTRKATGTLDQLDLNLSRDIVALPGGPLAIALGGEGRREQLTDTPSSGLENGGILGIPIEISAQDASRNVGAAFIEVNLPVLKGLELGASVRYDHYSDFGGTTNPKLAMRWQPTQSLLLRGAWGTGFRAPTLPDLFTARSARVVGGPGIYDPARCPVTGSIDDCSGEYTLAIGGNKDLQPETSTQYSAGMVWEPSPGISLGLEWWKIEKKNVIGNYIPRFIVANFDRYGSTNVIRGPIDPAYPTLPGPIETFIGWNENIGTISTSGIDVSAKASTTTAALGRFQFSLEGTYIHDWVVGLSGLQAFDEVGSYGIFAVPRWRHYAQLNWQQGPWSATLAQTFQSGYTDELPTPIASERQVGSYSLWDVQGVYSGFRNVAVAFGIRNLFDTDPPLSNQFNTAQVGYDPAYADPRGRTFYARLNYSFR